MRLRVPQPLHDLLERVHPREHEVAVGQEDPVAVLDPALQQGVGDGSLTLTEREGLEPVVHRVVGRKGGEGVDGIDAGGEDEDEGKLGGALGEDGVEVEGRRLYVLDAEVVDDEGRGGEHDTVGPDAAQDGQPLQLVKVALPVAGQGAALRHPGHEPVAPVAVGLLEGGVDVAEGREDLSSSQDEGVLVLVELAASLQDPRAHVEGEKELVPLEQPAAGVLVHRVRVVLVEVLETIVDLVALRAEEASGSTRLEGERPSRDGLEEQSDVRIQRKLTRMSQRREGQRGRGGPDLVHRVHQSEIVEHKVQDGGSKRRRAVILPRKVDRYLGLLSDFQLS
eukprot:758242-Hanusia_phi.AAC.5